jgi:membrane fusion protein (multidrug efflux system)
VRRIVVAVAAVLVLAAGAYFLFRAGPGGPGHMGGPGGFAIPVEAAKVRTDTVIRAVPAIGTLRSGESVVIRPEIAGRINEIRFKEGGPTARGDVLVTLDDDIARSQLNEARASLNLSRANFDRASKLYQQKVGSAQARDQALANMRMDEARVAVARAQLDKTVIRAPFDGVIGLKKVSPGDYVTVGADIVNVEHIDTLKIDFAVPELVLPELAVGQTVNVSVDALPGHSFEGKVYAIDPLVEAKGRSIAIRATIENGKRVLRPGLFARIALVTRRIEGALLVPEEAIVPVGADKFVFRIIDGKAQMTRVEVGLRRTGEVQIVGGLAAGDTVVTAGQIKLRDGAPVAAAPAGAIPDLNAAPKAAAPSGK